MGFLNILKFYLSVIPRLKQTHKTLWDKHYYSLPFKNGERQMLYDFFLKQGAYPAQRHPGFGSNPGWNTDSIVSWLWATSAQLLSSTTALGFGSLGCKTCRYHSHPMRQQSSWRLCSLLYPRAWHSACPWKGLDEYVWNESLQVIHLSLPKHQQ